MKEKVDPSRAALTRLRGGVLRLSRLLILWAASTPLAAQTLNSSSSQTFAVGDPVTASATITIGNGPVAGTVSALNNIRIRIPATFNMTWRTGLTTVSLGGTAASKVSATLLPYEDGGRTVALDVTTSFAASDTLTISGLQFTDFSAPSAASNLVLELLNDGGTSATDTATITITAGAAANLLSAASQVFSVGSGPVAIAPITVTDAAVASITAANDIRIRIPSTFNMTWNTADTAAVLSGPAAGKVSGTVSYEDAGQTLVLNVTASFVPGDSIVVSGLSFASFTAVSALDNLELEVRNDGAVTDTDDRAISIVAALATLSSSGSQVFTLGAAPTAAATITITDNAVAPVVKAATDIRIRIPAGFGMTWRTALTTATIGGSGASKVSIVLLPYEDGGQTVVLDVTSDFVAGDQITVAGLQFMSFTLPSPADNLELEVANDGAVTDTDDKTITISGPTSPTLSSAANQSFLLGGPLTAAATITVTDASPNLVTAANDIRIRIPATFNMTWDTTDLTAVVGGPAAAKVSPTVTYEDGGKTVVLNVTSSFAAGDWITVAGLGFTSFTAASAIDNLELELLNNGAVNATDDKTILIGSVSISSAGNQTFTAGQASTAISPITITDAAVPSITAAAATGDIRIRIPATFNMTWDTADTTATIGGGAAAKVSSTVTYEDAGKTVVLNVTANFVANDQITVSGLSFTAFTAASTADNLELEVKNDGALSGTDNRTIAINDAQASVSSAANQTFTVGGAPVAISTITVTSGSGTQLIIATAGTGDIRIRIPATFPMTWDTADTTATIGGAAAAKVSPTVTYEDAGKTLVLNVTADFLPQQAITVSGLSFLSFTAGAAADNLELEVRNDGAVTDFDNRTIAITAPLTISSAANQAFTVGAASTAAAVITITDNTTTPQIKSATASGDLRIHIPAAFNMVWDATVTTVTLGGGAAGRVSATLSAYEDAGKTAVLNVTSDFAAGDQVTVSGLRFMSFTAPSAASNLTLEVANDGVTSATDNRTITINAGPTPLISSAANQVFTIGDPLTAAAVLTITDAAIPQIVATAGSGDIRIRIPATFSMTWDTTDLTAVVGGPAAAKVSTTLLAYEDGGKTLVLNVTTNFASGDWITVSGVSFTAFSAASALDNLELEVKNNNVVTATDDKTIFIGSALAISSAANQTFLTGAAPTAASVITITDSGVTPRIKAAAASGDLRIHIPAAFNMIFDPTVTTVTLGGGAAGKVSATLLAYEDGGKTAVLDVTTDFAAGDLVTVTGLRFMAFATVSAAASLTLEVANDNAVSATDNRTKQINAGTTPVLTSAANQVFTAGDPLTAAASFMVSNGTGAPQITAGNDIRIRIPATFNMSWDTADLSVVLGGPAAAKVSTTLAAYEDAGKTLVLNVTSNFVAGDWISVAGVSFTAFTAASALDNLELEVLNDGAVTDNDDLTVLINGALAILSSAANQVFPIGGVPAAMATLTVTSGSGTQLITLANATGDIRIRIPAAFPMTWNTALTTATLGGTAAAKVSTTVSYEDAGKTLVLNVTADFLAQQTLVVSGLQFMNFTASAAADNLELELRNDGALTATDDKTITIASVVQIASAVNQTFTVGQAATAAAVITITDASTPVIKSSTFTGDLRIHIPAGFNMTWDTSVTTITRGGSASGKVSATLRAYEDGGRTAVVDVTSNFAGGDVLTITGLRFMGFSLPSPLDNLELEVANDGLVSATDSRTIVINPGAVPVISSAVNQAFTVGDPLTAAATITIIDSASGQIVQNAPNGDIRIRIPATFNMTWDTTDLSVVIGGVAAAKVSTTLLAYEDAGKTLVLNVTSNFAAGDWITVSGVSFTSFSAVSALDNLELEIANNGVVAATDDKTIVIGAPLTLSSAANQTFTVGAASTLAQVVTITDASTPTITASTASGDIRIRIPATFNMTFDTAVTTLTLGGSAAGKVSATLLAYEDGGRTAVLNVTTNFAGADQLTVSGLRFSNFTAPSPADNLELEVANNGTVAATDNRTITINSGAIPTLSSAADQVFDVADPPTTIATLTVTDATVPQITAAAATGDIRIRIPATFNMTWDTTDTTASIGGGAAAKVSTTVTYEDAGRTLVLNVTSNFAGGDSITVSGLRFANFTSGSALDNLELEVKNDNVVTDLDDKTILINDALATVASAASQVFYPGIPPVPMSTLTVTSGTGTNLITAAGATGDVRIRIPAGYPMTWDTTLTAAVLGGAAAAKVSPTVSYEDGGQTLVLNVTSDFGGQEQVTISGLAFANFAAVAGITSLELEIRNDGSTAALDGQTKRIRGAPSISSAFSQSFLLGGVSTLAATITITDDATSARVTSGNDIRIRIPAGFPMVWDTSVTTITLGGPDAGNLSANLLGYEDGAQTAVVNVTSSFNNGDQVTIAGLRLRNFTSLAAPDNLELEVDNNGVLCSLDDKTKRITSAKISSGSNQVFSVGAAPTAADVITITDNALTPSITAGANLRIRIPAGFNMTWRTDLTAVTLGGSAASKVSATLLPYEDGQQTVVLDVLTSFAVSDQLTILGLQFTSFVAPSALDNLELEVANDGVVTDYDDKTIVINPGATPNIQSAANQLFPVGGAATAISPITITDASVPAITAAAATGDIRVRIPAGFNMVWDTSDTTVVITGAAAAKISTTVTYEDAAKTLVLNVTSNFAAGEWITVSGLSFTGFLAPSPASNLQLEVRNDGALTDTDTRTITVANPAVAVSSAGNQSFTVGNPPAPSATITIFEHALVPAITAANDLRVRIPSGFNMTWRTLITTVTLGGSAAGKVSATLLPYEDGGRTLVLDVTTSFAAGDTLTLDGLQFTNFSAPSASDNLELEVANDGVATAIDDKAISILPSFIPTLSSSQDQAFAVGDPPTPVATMTVTDGAISGITVANDIRIRIPATFNMLWDVADTVATIGGPAAAKVDPNVSYEDAGRTLVLDVVSPFAANDSLTISGLRFISFTASSPVAYLELEVGNDGLLTDQDDKTIQIAQVSYFSIGTNAGSLFAGTASVAAGSVTVTFGAALPPNIGLGDRIVIGGETLYVLSRDSATQVTLQAPATLPHVNDAANLTRAFGGASGLQDWETARQGDLVATGRREVGVVYADGTFVQPVTIDGSITDATHYMSLVVAEGQRHAGTAGSGVLLDGLGAGWSGVVVRDSYTTVDGLGLARTRGADGVAAVQVQLATGVVLNRLLIYDFADAAFDVAGVLGGAASDFTLRNTIIYDGDTAGVRTTAPGGMATIQNTTVYGMAGRGIYEDQGTYAVTNTVAMGSPVADLSVVNGTQSNNMSADATAACGPTCRPGALPTAQFVSVPGRDFHLLGTAPARGAGANLLALFREDVDGQARLLPWDMGADEFELTTEVELLSFTAVGLSEAVDLSWTTASELRNLGFHLYRSSSAEGPWERITSALIPGLGSSPTGATYGHRDLALPNGVTFFYMLEDVETSGRTTWHGPVSAVPQAGGEVFGGGSGTPGGGTDGPGAGQLYGQPGAPALRIVERGASFVVLELTTPGFHAVSEGDGSVRLELQGFELRGSPGSPAVPTRKAMVDALAGRRARVAFVSTADVVTFGGLTLAPEGSPEVEVSEEGVVRAGIARRGLTAGATRGGFYPQHPARLLGTVFQGETKMARLELSPLRYDAASKVVVLARSLLVRVEFSGLEAGEKALGGPRGRRPRGGLTRAKGVVAQLATREAGLYRVPFEAVFPNPTRGVLVSLLRLSRRGTAVPFHVEPTRALFGPGSFLYFVGGGDLNPNGDAVYELETGRTGVRMGRSTATPTGPDETRYEATLVFETNRFYQAALLDAPDLWLWDLLVSPVSKSYPFTLSQVDTGGPGRLRVWLQGASDFDANPDHHLRVSLNGTFLAEASWDGKREQAIEVDLAPGSFQEGSNSLTLQNVGDTPAAYSMVFLNRFEVTVPRIAVAEGGKLEGRFTQSGSAAVTGLPAGSLLVDTTSVPRWLEGATASGGALRFQVEAGGRYLALDPAAALTPEVRPVTSRLRSVAQRADWLLLAPRAFLAAAQPLVALRREQGLLAKTVALEDVYQEFGFGEQGPEAIRGFLEHAWHNWRKPSPRYVVLLGDSTYDPKDYLGTHVADRVPFYPVKTSYLWTASDPTFAAVNGEDLLPDLAIGRLSAGSEAEAETLVAKLVAFERAGRTFDGRAVLVADNADIAGAFESDSDDIEATVLQGREVKKIYLRDLGSGGTRAEIRGAFDAGASLLSYVGHGGTAVWASENVFNNQDVPALAAQAEQPFLMTMNCLNGFFHFPPLNSLTEALVKADGKGAIAAFSPSGLSLNDAAHLYHKALLAELTLGAHERLGDALVAAQADYAASGAFPELLSIYHLFGDPAMTLKH